MYGVFQLQKKMRHTKMYVSASSLSSILGANARIVRGCGTESDWGLDGWNELSLLYKVYTAQRRWRMEDAISRATADRSR